MTLLNPEHTARRIAYFITPHGFGHAARAAGVMAALHEIKSLLQFDLFTTVPEWFFQDSLSGPFTYHSFQTDIGLVQKTPLQEDLSKTLQSLDAFLPFDRVQISSIAQLVNSLKCALIICDIAPMGIVVAQEAGIPSVLIENFTWDWIYQEYESLDDRIGQHITYLQSVFAAADYHIQTEPVCCFHPADLTTRPVSRNVRTPPKQLREQLGIPMEAKTVMITMGGVPPQQYTFLEQLTQYHDVYFVIPGATQSLPLQRKDNLILLPHHSAFFHPDMINSCDAVIGKVGYSTVAEVYYAGIPFGYISRPRFRESEILAAYVEQHMSGFAIFATQFAEGKWISRVPDLLAIPRIQRPGPNGAVHVAQALSGWIDGEEASPI